MNHKLQKDVKRYLRTISKQLPNKGALMDLLCRNLDDFLAEHPESTLDSIIEEFGSPTKIAASFKEQLPEIDIAATPKKTSNFPRSVYCLFFMFYHVCFYRGACLQLVSK